ncbi:MAPEG family protein [Aestuariibacter halophilus]|uniref:MAPEG family protein n=1 Tax=Fluctibacter halophilus TaxID=226011 RepID=A0ABS8GAR3_9ALTE|nr:MAPEG family protein [Aestuariibacter halophilus]MCC2616321.1 MAPEG family protein [Aestuariibacter halophilus]
MSVSITAFYASLLALFYLYLSGLVIRHRLKEKVALGDGGNRQITQTIRAHANFSEYVPLALILLLVAELNGVDSLWLHGNGALLLVARVFHAIGLRHHYGTSWQRFSGTVVTFLVLACLATLNLISVYGLQATA